MGLKMECHSTRTQYSRTSISGPALSVRIISTAARYDSFHKHFVQHLAGLSCKRELDACFLPPALRSLTVIDTSEKQSEESNTYSINGSESTVIGISHQRRLTLGAILIGSRYTDHRPPYKTVLSSLQERQPECKDRSHCRSLR
jgi:hypothetical protein